MMKNLILQFSECADCREVDCIVDRNILKQSDRLWLCKMAKNAKRRILRVKREAKKSFKNQLN